MGCHFIYFNKWLPVSINYMKFEEDQQKKYTDRIYQNEGNDLIINANKKIILNDRRQHAGPFIRINQNQHT